MMRCCRHFKKVVFKLRGSYACFSIMGGHPEDIAGSDGNRAELRSSFSPDFEAVLKSDTFVDKSGLILAVFKRNLQAMVLCTAPRRFGKSVNLTMMQKFFELEVDENGKEKITVLEEKDNYKLFNSARFKLKVMENKKFVETHFGQYPIIKIKFLCDDDVNRQSDAVRVCREAIRQAFTEHKYLYKSKESPLENDEKECCEQWCDESTCEEIPDKDINRDLAWLAVYLNKFHKKKVFLLVDDYDSFVLNALYNVKAADPKAEGKELERIATLPFKVIGYALKVYSNILQGAYITGILNIAEIATFSSILGSVSREQFGTHNLCQDFFGFTENEVRTLFNRWGVDEELKEKAMARYNGYSNAAMKSLYNPQSIVQFLHNLAMGEGALQNYWQQFGDILHLDKLLREDGMRKLLNELLQGVIHFEIDRETPLELDDLKDLHNLLIHSNWGWYSDVIVTFLVSLGYLTYSVNDYKLKIPNSELIDEFTMRLQDYFFERYGINSRCAEACSESFSKLARLCDEDDSLAKFKEALENFQNNITCLLQQSTNIDPLNEAIVQAAISSTCPRTGFLFGNEIITPNYETRIDVILYNDKFGSVVKIKCDPQTVEDALKQIFELHYCNVFTMKKYFNDRQKAPSLSLVMGIHVDSAKKASVLCLRRKDIIDVLDDLKVEAEPLLETRIEIAVNSMGERSINTFCEKAIRVL